MYMSYCRFEGTLAEMRMAKPVKRFLTGRSGASEIWLMSLSVSCVTWRSWMMKDMWMKMN